MDRREAGGWPGPSVHALCVSPHWPASWPWGLREGARPWLDRWPPDGRREPAPSPELNPDSGAPVGLSPTTVPVLGLHFDRWFGGSERVGFRVAGAWQAPDVPWVQGNRTIDVVSGDVSLLVRLITTRDDEGLSVLPYVLGGFGGIWYDLGEGDQAGFPAAETFHDGERRISTGGRVRGRAGPGPPRPVVREPDAPPPGGRGPLRPGVPAS